MTQRQAVTAFGTLMKVGQKVHGKDAFALFRLKKALAQIVEFQSEEERKLVDKYEGKITETGQIIVTKNKAGFLKEYSELGNMECDIQPVEIGEIDLTLEEIENLDGFVKFTEV